MKRLLWMALVGGIVLIAVYTVQAQTGRGAGPVGRFSFYPPPNGQTNTDGVLLDTSTGDIWIMGVETNADGSLTPVLLPIKRSK